MIHKLYKNKIDIIKWLESMDIKKYKLVSDPYYTYKVDVLNDVILYNKKLTSIPIKFNIVIGSFNCSENNLTSLVGAPHSVRGDFCCLSNNLTNLIGSPLLIESNFYGAYNLISSLKGITANIMGDLQLHNNKINTLIHIPNNIGGKINLNYNPSPLLENLQNYIYYPQLREMHRAEIEKNSLQENIKACSTMKANFNNNNNNNNISNIAQKHKI